MISGKDLEGWITAPDPLAAMEKAQNQALHRERRERIATACMAGMLANEAYAKSNCLGMAQMAVVAADALIAKLDKEVQP